jgi:hypothetical protein
MEANAFIYSFALSAFKQIGNLQTVLKKNLKIFSSTSLSQAKKHENAIVKCWLWFGFLGGHSRGHSLQFFVDTL